MIAAFRVSSSSSGRPAAGPAEAHGRERDGRQPLPLRVGVHPAGELGGKLEVALDPPAQALEPEPAQLDPQLERPEPPAELRLVLVVVADRGLAIERAQVLGHEAEGRPQVGHAPGQQQRRVERREQPLVRVHDDRIGTLPARERRSPLGQHRHDARIGRVDVQPQPLALRDVGEGRDRIDRGRRGRAEGRHDRDRPVAGGPVGGDGRLERLGAHLEALVRPAPGRARHAPDRGSCTPSRSSCAPRSSRRPGARARPVARPDPAPRRRTRPPGARRPAR